MCVRRRTILPINCERSAFAPPVVYFVEWVDMWSMGDLFHHWLTLPDGPKAMVVYTDTYEIFAYGLPDEDKLRAVLSGSRPPICC